MNEHRASSEKGHADADPVEIGGRLASSGKMTLGPGNKDVMSGKCTGGVRRSSGDGMRAGESQRNTGSPPWRDRRAPTAAPRGADRAAADDGEARSSEEAGNDRGAKEPQFQGNVSRSDGAEIGASLPPPEKLRELQAALQAKAKGNPADRFYALHDKVHRKDVLAEAWRKCRANGGAPGVDGVTFEQIEQRGVAAWLEERAQSLRTKTYRPLAVQNQPVDGTSSPEQRSHRGGRRAQRSAARMGPMLPSWLRQQSLSSGGRACPSSVAPVVGS